ncbi:MAG: alanine--tRNA ligase [Acidobacteria bacterium]|nr:alanine--tRNA ligase [Acidobacteriota bacterium]
MKGSEIRQKFLEYFERNGHKIVHSSPLLPANDPTLLFTNAGMNQFKDVFTGQDKRDYTRAVSSQKCIRAGGKHNDLDEVGKTARHHTFFEMLGNFSFGDYFKEDAIRFAWDFLVNELKLDESRLWFSVFEGDAEVPADDEARELWQKAGARPERILGFGRKDNFWQMGDTGPCGPCSEIHYYMGDDPDDPEKNHARHVNGEGDTTMEIWNLVFMQFERSEDGAGGFKLTPLPAPSVDTGAGLERVAAVMQGVATNYDTDLIKPIINITASLTVRDGMVYPDGKELVVEDGHYTEKSIYDGFDEQQRFACRVIADHARATAFAIADGILPGNEGRNYVLRKIMRRAIYHGREHLGFDGLFFYKVCDFVVEKMKDAYPELETQRAFIGKMVRLEEERFGNTLTVGLKKLDELIKSSIYPVPTVNASDVAKLRDTYGTPVDLMYVILSQGKVFLREKNENGQFSGTSVDNYSEEFFRSIIEKELRILQHTSEIGKTKQAEKINPIYAALERTSIRSNFHGYDKTEVAGAKVVALVKADERVDELVEGDEGLIVLDETPFYAESGGQVGDTGEISGEWRVESGEETAHVFRAKVFDTFAPISGVVLHKSKIEKGSVRVGDTVTATVDVEKRDATRRNHTATHLVHAALREVLGTHVKQAGSIVAPNYLRFDYAHYQPLTAAEIQEIEDLVNRYILRNEPVNTDLMAVEDAMRSGAMALFGEKYGAKVRVLSVGDGVFSRELCGGTHVRATGDIGSFKITADEAIAAGVRRIRAITGFDAFERFREDERLIDRSLQALKTQRDQLPSAIEKLQEELKRTRKEVDELKMKIATGAVGNASANGDEAKDVAGVRVVARTVEGLDKSGMRHLSDTLMAKLKSGVVILGRTEEDKVSFIVRVSDDLTAKVKAGEIVKQIAPIVAGRGGGKPDMAEGGGTDASKLGDALDASYGVIERMLS